MSPSSSRTAAPRQGLPVTLNIVWLRRQYASPGKPPMERLKALNFGQSVTCNTKCFILENERRKRGTCSSMNAAVGPAGVGAERTIRLAKHLSSQATSGHPHLPFPDDGVRSPSQRPQAARYTIRAGILERDVNARRNVSASDTALGKSRLGQVVDGSNFRTDVNGTDVINASDIAIVKSRAGTGLP